jgi:nucleoid-associated protein YgaU
MHKDFKIGLAVGLFLAAVAAVWLCTLPRLSTKARALQSSIDQNPPAEQPPQIIPDENYPAPNVPPTATNLPPSAKFHVVQKGDTLSGISMKYYGSPRRWQKILSANRDRIPDPNRLTPGSRLIIPE